MSAEEAPPAGRSKDAAPPPPTASAADLAEAAALSDRLRPRLERLLAGEPAVAVAVSGGRDSLALLILTAAFARGRAEPLRVAALSVDHGLRDGSRAEAESVAGHAAALGAESALLVWEEREERSGNLQAAARAARYRLMRAWRRAHGVGPLLTAHHREDVAETFLLRLARGSGVDGLAGMAEETIEEAHDDLSAERPGPRLRLIRPLLETPGAALGAVCRAAGRAWIEDPSNADPRFDRARARALAEPLAALGLDAPRLANTARAMARARTALEEGTAALLATAAAREEALGLCRLALPPLARAPRELQLRALRACLRWVAAAPYPPRLDALEAALDALLAAPAARTLGGCQIAPDGAEAAVWIWREPHAAAPPAALRPEPPGGAARASWDGRFHARLDGAAPPVEARLGPLGAAGAAAALAAGQPLPEAWRRAPRAARLAAPAVFLEGRLAAAPAAGLCDPRVTILSIPRVFS